MAVNDDKKRLMRAGPKRTRANGEPRVGRRPIPMLRARILHSAMELFGDRGFDDVLQSGHVLEEIELMKDHPDTPAS